MSDQELKLRLYDFCLDYAANRLGNLRSAIESARESANEDNKSSAGDKHETGRSMAQLEQEKLSAQLQDAEKMVKSMNLIERGGFSSTVKPGSIIFTDNGNYFLSISAGKISIADLTFFAVSAVSPIGNVLMHKKEGEAFVLNGLTYRIKKIC
jgi:transcription elongation GreA/GreB family factor